MNRHVTRITELAPRPSDPSARNWEEVERSLGTVLPADYKKLVDVFGGGVFDGYLWLLEPDCGNHPYDLAGNIDERSESLEYLWESGEPQPTELREPGSKLIPWASTDNGEFLYWLAQEGQAPESWSVMINEARGEEWEHHPSGCAELLADLLSGETHSEILSPNFPKPDHTFTPSSEFV
jgi:SMI1-KNR4 cell-wall